jgi:transcriptional regulator with XRE-family HTH domain
MNDAERFAANLIRCREDAGLTRGELATRAALHKSQIERLERAQAEPLLSTAIKLAASLSVPVGALLVGIDPRAGESEEGR